MMYQYRYPRPMVTVDILILQKRKPNNFILLIKRGRPPFKDTWALPGGFVGIDESLKTAAMRELREETGVREISLTQLGTFGNPARDPRGRTITIVYGGVVQGEALQNIQAGDDAASAQWFPVNNLPPLAFDHSEIIRTSLPLL